MIAVTFLLLLTCSVINAYTSYGSRRGGSSCSISKLVVFGAGYEDDGVSEDDDKIGLHKYSTGKVWPQFLADMMGLPLQNDAMAGGTSGYDNLYFKGFSGNKWQVDRYISKNKNTGMTNVIFGVASGGVNEMFDLNYADAKLNAMVANIMDGLKLLSLAGAKTIFVLNLPDYTLAPAFKNGSTLEPTSSTIAAKNSTSEGILNHNAKMKQAVEALRQNALYKGTNFIDIDFYTFWKDGINTKKYKSTYATACGGGLEVFADIYEAGTAKPEDILNYAFYDAYHPASGVHKYIAEKIKARLDTDLIRRNY